MEQQPPFTAEPTATEILVRDPLSPVTRKERLYLLAVSMIGIAMVRTGLVPSKIATFGIELDSPNRNALLFLLALVTIYFLAAFVIYAASDYIARREALKASGERRFSTLRYREVANRLNTSEEYVRSLDANGSLRAYAVEVLSNDDMEVEATLRLLEVPKIELLPLIQTIPPEWRSKKNERMIAKTRIFFEFLLPLLVGGYAIAALLARSLL